MHVTSDSNNHQLTSLLSELLQQVSMEKIHSEILDAFHRSSLRIDTVPTSCDNPVKSSPNDCDFLSQADSNFSLSSQEKSFFGSACTRRDGDSGDSPLYVRTRLSRIQRRLKEAVLFYESVGEKLPAHQCDLAKLIDDDKEDRYPDSDESVVDIDLNNNCDNDIDCDASQYPPALSDTSIDSSSSSTSSLLHSRPRSKEYLANQFAHRLPGGMRIENFQYKGLNAPDVVSCGTQRGNYSSLHRKAWLESADMKHRYGKNLRIYYRYWESLGFPTDLFFDWLDCTGEAEGLPLPNLSDCPRSELDNDRVEYISDFNVTRRYALSIVCDDQGRGIVSNLEGVRVRTGSDGWIFVLRDDVLYGTLKVTTTIDGFEKRRFHHSSFFGGKAVAAAGILVTDNHGVLVRALPHSGHYRPGEAEVQRMLYYFMEAGVDLHTFDVDIQQIIYLNRQSHDKKRDTLHLRSATTVADYLAHKARLIELGIFDHVHNQRGRLGANDYEDMDMANPYTYRFGKRDQITNANIRK